MKFKILGSGVCTSISRPTCNCRVCDENAVRRLEQILEGVKNE